MYIFYLAGCNSGTLNDKNTHGVSTNHFHEQNLCFRSLMTRKFCRAIPSKVLRLRAINTKVESGRAATRIESDGYKKKLLASQTHLDLQTVLAFALLFSPLSLSPPLRPLVPSLLPFLRDILSPFLRIHFLFYSKFYLRPLPSFPQDYSGYFPIPLLHTRNLNYRCPSQSAATHSSTSVSGPE